MNRITSWARGRVRLGAIPATSRRRRLRLRPELSAMEGRVLMSTFVVTSTSGANSPGTLSYVIGEANNAGDAATIAFDSAVFDTPQTIAPDSLPLVFSNTQGITIDGPGADLLTIDGSNSGRILFFEQGSVSSVSGLTLTRGDGYSGGPLDNDGSYELGGAVANVGGTTTLTDCDITDSSAHYGGGGVADVIGSLDMVDCSITGNTADQYSFSVGGGVINCGTMEMTGCTVSGNYAPAAGGIYNGTRFYNA